MKNFKYIWFTNNNDYFLKIEIFRNIRDVFLCNKKTKEFYLLKSLDVEKMLDAELYSLFICMTDFNYFLNFINEKLKFTNLKILGDNRNEKE